MNTIRKIGFQILPRVQIHGANELVQTGRCADPRCERVGAQIHGANGSLKRVIARAGQALAGQGASGSVRRSTVQMWRNLNSELTGDIDLILIYWGRN